MFVLGSFALFAQDSLQTKQDTNVVLQAIIPLATDTLPTQPVMGKDSAATLNHVTPTQLSIPESIPLPQATYTAQTAMMPQRDTSFNFVTVEAKTYAQFLGQFWDELVVTGEKALNKHIDYYYLRLRLGVAYFQLQKFRLAEKQFNKAMQLNSEDPFLKEYLYFTYLKNAHYEQALKLSIGFDSTLKAKTVGNDLPIHLIYSEAGAKVSNDHLIFENASYVQAGIGHRLSKYLNLTHAFTQYDQKGFYGKVNQKQYYLGLKIPFKKTWLFSPSYHYVTYDLDTSRKPMPGKQNAVIKTSRGAVYALNLKKSFTYFDISAGYSYSNLNDSIQNQETVNINLYPFANNKFSIGATGIMQQRNALTTNSLGYNFNATYTPNWRFKLDVAYYTGDLRYNNEDNGFLVNNSYYITTNRLTLTPQIALSKKIDAYMIYQYENKALTTYTFQYNNFFLGLKYKF